MSFRIKFKGTSTNYGLMIKKISIVSNYCFMIKTKNKNLNPYGYPSD